MEFVFNRKRNTVEMVLKQEAAATNMAAPSVLAHPHKANEFAVQRRTSEPTVPQQPMVLWVQWVLLIGSMGFWDHWDHWDH